MSYAVYINGMKLSVNPEKITVRSQLTSKEYDIVKQGKVQVPNSMDLRYIEFDVEFPGKIYSYVDATAWKKPSTWFSQLLLFQVTGKPIQFLAMGDDGSKISMKVTIEKFDKDENAGQEGDFEVQFRFKEYVDFGVQSTDLPQLNRPTKVPETPTMITVKSGQTAKTVISKSVGSVNNSGNLKSVDDVEFMKEASSLVWKNKALIPSNEKLTVVSNEKSVAQKSLTVPASTSWNTNKLPWQSESSTKKASSTQKKTLNTIATGIGLRLTGSDKLSL